MPKRPRVRDAVPGVRRGKKKDSKKKGGAAPLDTLPLSVHMRESWETGRFWLNYAVKKRWVFDIVFWAYF